VMAAAGFSLALLSADWEEERSTWNRLTSPRDAASLMEQMEEGFNLELTNLSDLPEKE
ncbi:AKT1, partial [Symbiodinium pilosum]